MTKVHLTFLPIPENSETCTSSFRRTAKYYSYDKMAIPCRGTIHGRHLANWYNFLFGCGSHHSYKLLEFPQ